MWTNYSVRYIKHNRLSSVFLGGISFIAATLLSLICGVFYNLWIDRVERQFLKTGHYSMALEASEMACAFVLALVCLSLIAMIHNAFEVSMNSRMHQLGILQSVGATPRQLKTFLLQEALVLCLVPIVIGVLVGILLCYGFMQLMIYVTTTVRVHQVMFRYHILIAVIAVVLSVVTVLGSAWIPARRISRLEPLTAIHYGGEPPFGKIRSRRIGSKLFGIYGELATKSLDARRKSLRTSTLSLMLAFLGFISFLNLEVMSGISTQRTYFERYREKWDLMLTTTDRQEEEAYLLNEIRTLDGVKNCIAYKKLTAATKLGEDMLSDEVRELGISRLTEYITQDDGGDYRLEVVIYVLDDDSFIQYLKEQELDMDTQAVALNLVWDSVNSDSADKVYVPLLTEGKGGTAENKILEILLSDKIPISIGGYANALPNIREEIKQYALSLVIPQKVYEAFAEQISDSEETQDLAGMKNYYNIHIESTQDDTTVQEKIRALMVVYDSEYQSQQDGYVLESRREKENAEMPMRTALKIVVGCLAGLLACIGIANVFSATLGQIYQRKKEFARYLSVGMSPKGMRKMLMMEALFLCFRPALFSLLLNVPLVLWGLDAAAISVDEFVACAPIVPVVVFTLFVMLFIGLAYYLGGRQIGQTGLVEVLKDEAMI